MRGRRVAPALLRCWLTGPERATPSPPRAVRTGRRRLPPHALPRADPRRLHQLIAVVTNQDPGDESRYLAYATNLTHGFYALTDSSDPQLYLWHGPGLPTLLAPLVALHLPLEVTRVLVGPTLLFATMVVFHHLVRLYLQ